MSSSRRVSAGLDDLVTGRILRTTGGECYWYYWYATTAMAEALREGVGTLGSRELCDPSAHWLAKLTQTHETTLLQYGYTRCSYGQGKSLSLWSVSVSVSVAVDVGHLVHCYAPERLVWLLLSYWCIGVID